MYITYEQYTAIYGAGDLTEQDFNRLGFKAQRVLDDLTTGVDGVRKLAVAWPTDEYFAECVRRCLCELIHTSGQVETARAAATATTQADGTVTASGAVTSLSSGSESMTFASGAALESSIKEAAGDPAKERELYAFTVRSYLGGVQDAKGVFLLYGGIYPKSLGGVMACTKTL